MKPTRPCLPLFLLLTLTSPAAADLAVLRLEPAGDGVFDLVLDTDVPTRAGEIGLRYRGAVLSNPRVEKGPDFPPGDPPGPTGSEQIYLVLSAAGTCPPAADADTGIIIGWSYARDGSRVLAAGRHAILRLRFDVAPGLPAGTCSPLRFADCLGPAEAPVQNVVITDSSRSLPAETRDSGYCASGCRVLRFGSATDPGRLATCASFAIELREADGTTTITGLLAVPARDLTGLDIARNVFEALVAGAPSDFRFGLTADRVQVCPPAGRAVRVFADGREVSGSVAIQVCGIDVIPNPPSCADTDEDARCDGEDNCPAAYNPRQEDIDLDGLGDACDPVRDPVPYCRRIKFDPLCAFECVGLAFDLRHATTGVPFPDARREVPVPRGGRGLDVAVEVCRAFAADPPEGFRAGFVSSGCRICRLDGTPFTVWMLFEVEGVEREVEIVIGRVVVICGLRTWVEDPADCTDTDGDEVCDEVDNCPRLSNPSQLDRDRDGLGEACEVAVGFIRSDVEPDGRCSVTDAVRILGFLFLGRPPALECESAADSDDNGEVTLTDAVYVLIYCFQGGRAPPAPFPNCGVDPTEDALPCAAFAGC